MLDASGEPITNTGIRLSAEYAGGEPTVAFARTDEFGEFVLLDDIPATAVVLSLDVQDGYSGAVPATWHSAPIEVPANMIVDLGDIALGGEAEVPEKWAALARN